MANIGDNIREARHERNLSLAQLAQATGLTKGFLSQVESGRSKPSLASLEKIALGLGISTRQLVSSGSSTTPNPLVPAFPHLIWADGAPDNLGTIEVVNASEAGTHFLVGLPPGVDLISDGALESAAILATVLEGSIRISQVSGTVQIGASELGTWNGGDSYSISSARNSAARVQLYIPRALSVPVFRPANKTEFAPIQLSIARPAVSTNAGNSRSRSGNSDGPMRLVAMRAQRLAERKRTP